MPGNNWANWAGWQQDVSTLLERVVITTTKKHKELANVFDLEQAQFERYLYKRSPASIDLVRRFVLYCHEHCRNVRIPDTISAILHEKFAEGTANLVVDIKAAIGLTSDSTVRSINFYSGHYWLIYWAEDDRIAVVRCCLHRSPRNGMPTYRAWRRTADLGFRVHNGFYFLEGESLSLVGTRQSDIDIRLSQFDCNPGQDEKLVLVGMTSGRDGNNDLFWSPSVLFRTRCFSLSQFDFEPGLYSPEIVKNRFGTKAAYVLANRAFRQSKED